MTKEYYLKLRNRYKPKKIKIVFVLESPPASGKYFYDENGLITEPLFAAMMELLKCKPKSKREGLRYFADTGHFLVDATYDPINGLDDKARKRAVLDHFDELVEDLRSLGSTDAMSLILVKANICRVLEGRLSASGFNVMNNGVVVPFPSTGQQGKFREKIAEVYNNIPDSA